MLWGRLQRLVTIRISGPVPFLPNSMQLVAGTFDPSSCRFHWANIQSRTKTNVSFFCSHKYQMRKTKSTKCGRYEGLTRMCGANGGSFWLLGGCDSGPYTFAAHVSINFGSSNSGILQHSIGSTSLGGGTKHFSSTCAFCWHSTDDIPNAIATNTTDLNDIIVISSPIYLNTASKLFYGITWIFENRILKEMSRNFQNRDQTLMNVNCEMNSIRWFDWAFISNNWGWSR